MQIFLGNALEGLQGLESDSVSLVVTSPPYPDKRAKSYATCRSREFTSWILPISEQIRRVLSPQGSFVLNVKEKVTECERDTYVLETILALREQGWLWVEEYIWHKGFCFPGKWRTRFRDAYERCLHFTRSRDFKMRQDAVRVEGRKSTKYRIRRGSGVPEGRKPSPNANDFAVNEANWTRKKDPHLVYPTNVLSFVPETKVNHPAPFPLELPSFFIKLFTDENDLVVDPFLGSGTSAVAAHKLGRRFFGCEMQMEYQGGIEDRLKTVDSRPDFILGCGHRLLGDSHDDVRSFEQVGSG